MPEPYITPAEAFQKQAENMALQVSTGLGQGVRLFTLPTKFAGIVAAGFAAHWRVETLPGPTLDTAQLQLREPDAQEPSPPSGTAPTRPNEQRN